MVGVIAVGRSTPPRFVVQEPPGHRVATRLELGVHALAIEPESRGRASATILAIDPDSTVRYAVTIIDP